MGSLVGRWREPASGEWLDPRRIETLASAIAARLSSLSAGSRPLAICGLPAAFAAAALIGAWDAGWTIVPLRFDATAQMRQSMLDQVGDGLLISQGLDGSADVMVSDGAHSQSMEAWLDGALAPAAAKAWAADEAAAVLFTSGSSGTPKGVVHSQGNMFRAAALFADHFQLRDGDTLACMAPVHTASGLRSLAMPLVRPVDVALWGQGTGALAETVSSLARLDPHMVLCGPQFVATLAAAGKRMRPLFPNLRRIASTGAALGEKDRLLAMEALGVEILDFYGLSETGGIVLAEAPGAPRPGYLPPACAGVEARLIATAAQPDIFELQIAGPNLFLGYLHEQRARRSLFATGDLVERQADGGLRLVGRVDHALKSEGTEWIFPERLENWFRNQHSVQDACVESSPGAPGERAGFRVVVQLAEGAADPDASAWRASIAVELGPEYARIQWVQGAVERSALGKINRVDKGT